MCVFFLVFVRVNIFNKACRDVVACLNAHTRLLNGVTNKDTLEVFFGEVGVRLFK